MRIAVRHQLSFDLGSGAAHAVQQVLLTPQSGPTQTVSAWSIEVEGIERAARFLDGYGNQVLLVGQEKASGEVLLTVSGVVDTVDRHGVVGRIAGEPVPALFRRFTDLTRPVAAIQEKFRGASRRPEDRIALLHGLMAQVGELYTFENAPPADDEEAPAEGQSQSQDGQSQSQSQSPAAEPAPKVDAATMAHAFIAAARQLDIPARFVSGYLAAAEDEPAAFHAWAEAYDEGLGWIAFDPSLQLCPTVRHIRVATGLDGLATSPLRCVPAFGETKLVAVSVEGQAAQ